MFKCVFLIGESAVVNVLYLSLLPIFISSYTEQTVASLVFEGLLTITPALGTV